MKLTYLLVLIAVAVFFATALAPNSDEIANAYGFSGPNLLARPYVAVTSIFLHASLLHLLSNVLIWVFVGASVEEELGKKKMLLLFFLSGFAGEALSLFAYPFDTVSIGASAAIFGLIGAGMLLRPLDLSLYPLIIPIPLALLGLLYAGWNTYEFLFSPDQTISYVGHFGGLAVGLLYGFRYGGLKRGVRLILVALAAIMILPLVWLLLNMA